MAILFNMKADGYAEDVRGHLERFTDALETMPTPPTAAWTTAPLAKLVHVNKDCLRS
jgi:hypothetical protein